MFRQQNILMDHKKEQEVNISGLTYVSDFISAH